MNFNSHAHVERDFCVSTTLTQLTISTHTLTWSVTQSGIELAFAKDISTHTLTWSVTR